jgi:UDP-glucuronate decarboxylase
MPRMGRINTPLDPLYPAPVLGFLTAGITLCLWHVGAQSRNWTFFLHLNMAVSTIRAVRRTALTEADFMHLEKRVLITGGAGFLGSHLCERLLRHGTIVVCVDNFFTGVRRNLEHLLDHKNFEVVRHDITFPLYVEVDEIYNLACPASPIHYQHDPVQTTKTSVLGAINMLGLAKRLRVKILQASTSEVYGDPSVHPQTENYWGHVNPIGPRSCYDEGKRCAETLFFDYQRQHKLPIKIARIFNTYGPRMHPNDGRVVSNFIVQALLGREITVFGDGLQSRSFCYVDDLIDGLSRLMNTPADVTGPINIGNPKEFTILELANMVIDLTGSRSRIVYRRRPQDDPRQRRPDISKANDLLTWNPQIPLSDGLTRTIGYFEELLSDDAIRPHILQELSATA